MKLISSRSFNKGFTLIELMIVVAIISILTGIIVTSLTSSKSKSRDAQRVSDINQIQLALEQYFDRCGQYPADIYSTASCFSGATSVGFNDYIAVVPHDPSDKTLKYGYAVNDASTPTDYVLHATLENPNQVQQNSFPESVKSDDFSLASFSCFDGQNGTTPIHPKEYCISTK